MSKTILVIDDEPLIAAGLSEKIDWSSINCRIVGTAANGSEGLRLIEELSPDIVISDIVMPGCSGIELAERCSRDYPRTKLILLSAYSEFGYAQQAIRFNVVDYVLKPIDSGKLLEAVCKAVSLIDEQDSLSSKMLHLESAVEDAKWRRSSSLLFDAARHGVAATPDAGELPDLPGVVLCVRMYNIPKKSADALRISARDLFDSQLKKDGVQAYFEGRNEDMIFLCRLHEGIAYTTSRSRILESARQAIDDTFWKSQPPALVTVCLVSRPYHDVAALSKRYRECLDALPATFFFTRSGSFPLEGMPLPQQEHVSDEGILHHLKNGNTEHLQSELQDALRRLERAQDSDMALNFLKQLHRHASTVGTKAGMSPQPVGTGAYLFENFARKSADMEDYLVAACKYIMSSNDFVSRLELLVEENYGDHTFGLATGAEIMGISSSYLSRLFKKKHERNFTDFLLDKRISQAKYLLETTTLRNRQIAKSVGFDSEHYFGQVFKKRCGITPKQFRENLQNNR